MKIAIIQPRITYYVGGAERVAIRHAEYLSKIDGNKVDVFTVRPPHSGYTEMYKIIDRGRGLSVIEKEVPNRYRYIYDVEPGADQSRWDAETILFNNLVYEDIKNGGYDVVLSYYIGDSLFKDLSTPNIVYLGGYPRGRIPMYTAFLNFCDATISNSKNVRGMWADDIKDSGVALNYVLGKGADIFKATDEIRNIQEGHLVFAGRLIERKGVKLLINVLGKIKKQFPDIKLYILGDGPQRKKLVDLVAKLKLKKNVVFTGAVDNVQDYFANSAACIFPSLEGEGLMTVVAEAMMSGACVITSKDMGSEEIIDNNITGILTRAGDEEELRDAIINILSDPGKREEISRKSLAFAEKNLSWAIVANQLDNILKEVIARFSAEAQI
ncbi:MAG: glycosyltransferase family 4 protein [Patescibacteria group bacterium]|nr:glycosyltransferase family 4 protein [Patescibacteria group bacterium]